MRFDMVKTWVFHGAVTAAWGSLGFLAGGSAWAIACALFYFGREVRQHEAFGTKGRLAWMDRIMDTTVPVAVALGFAVGMA